ncbi:MAG: MaoC family dehydratase [Methylocystis sp.]
MRQGLYLEDLAVGQIYRAGPLKLEAEDLIRFARDYDPQYFHTDPEAAKSSMFGGLIGSGWQTAALTMRLVVESGAPFADGAVGVGIELAWPRPVRPGDSIRVEAEVTNLAPLRSRPDRGIATFKIVTLNQKDEVVQTLSGKMIISARGGRSGA